MPRRIPTLSVATAAALAVGLLACGGEAPPGGSATPATAGAPAAQGGRGGGGGGAPRARAILSASDIATVRAGTIEATTPIAGDLRPLETVAVRARLEADVLAVLVRDGDQVRAGTLLARLDASELEALQRSAEADSEAARADLATAEWNAEQSETLFAAGAIAEAEVRAARQALSASRARAAAAAARLRTASRDLDAARVTAPIAGLVSQRLVQPGERVARGAQLFTLVRQDVLELAAAVPARAAGGLAQGQRVRFTVDGRRYDGRVARVGAAIDPASRAVTVYAEIPNRDGALRANAFATGRVVGRVVRDALLVPIGAIRQPPEGGQPFVYRLAGEQLDIATVSLGVVDDDAGVAQILDGLAAGDRVVVGSVGTLGRGMQVTIVGGEKGAAPAR
jgi:RND family efflux transporter MFP subunit